MTENIEEESVSRRNFLRNMGIAVLAATTAGTTAAMLSKEMQKAAVTSPIITELPPPPSAIPAVPAIQSAQSLVTAHNDAGELLQRLAASQAENMRLQAALEAAQRDLDSLSVTNNSNRSATEELSLQLAGANEEIGILGGLVALYQQLDDVDVAETIQSGMSTVSQSIADLINQTPILSEGIQLGQQALTEVEEHLPVLEDGRLWMDAQLNKLAAFYDTVELVLQSVIESVGSFLEMVNDWFSNIQKWLPFGIGEKAANVVNSISALVDEIPQTISGLDTHMAQPLDHWLAREEGVPKLQQKLIKPVREKVLAEANETINRAQFVQQSFQQNMAAPVETALSSREFVQQQIADYRRQHQV